MRTFPFQKGLIVGQSFKLGGSAIGGAPDLFENSSTPTVPVGSLLECSDGRTWRYIKADAATNASLVVAQDLTETGLARFANGLPAAGAGFNSAGDKKIRVSSTDLSSIAEDAYAGGYIGIVDGTGESFYYAIKGNDATTGNKTDLYIWDTIQTTLDATSDIEIIGNLYYDVGAATAGTDEMVAAVTMAALTVNYYGWGQTRGPGLILCDGTINMGDIVTLSDGVAGAIQTLAGGGTDVGDAITEPIIGRALHAGATTEYTLVAITLE